jgi:HEPN domain-containing protein
MSEFNDPMDWVARAEEDYVLAGSALRRKQPLLYGACFHAQQCAEKYLKAILVANGQTFPKTHDLLVLNDLCISVGVFVVVDVDRLDLLSAYAVKVRYPGDDPLLEEAQSALNTAKTVRRFARKLLGVK